MRHSILITLISLAGLAGLAACGSKNSAVETGGATSPQTAEEEAATSPEPDEAAPAETEGQTADASVETAEQDQAPEEPAASTPPPSSDLQAYVKPSGPSPEFQAMGANLDKIRSCYLKEKKDDPELAGNMTVQFTIKKNGKAKKVEVKSSDLPKKVEKCVIKEIKKIDFPKQKHGPKTMEFPFQFKNED